MKNWLSKTEIEKEIDGEKVVFRRVPVGTLQKFRHVSDDVSKGLGMLFKDDKHDHKTEQISTPSDAVDSDGTPYMTTQYTEDAPHVSTISMRKTQIEEGIRALINAVMRDESMEVLCEIIAKSAFKEEWPDDLLTIRDEMDPVTFGLHLKYAFEASVGDYASLGKSLLQNTKVSEVLDQVKTNLK